MKTVSCRIVGNEHGGVIWWGVDLISTHKKVLARHWDITPQLAPIENFCLRVNRGVVAEQHAMDLLADLEESISEE